MGKISIMVAFLVLVCTGFVYAGYEKVNCSICGKVMQRYVESFDNFYVYNNNDNSYKLEKNVVVCQECYEKYYKEYEDLINSFVDQKREENKDLIKENEEKEKNDKITEKLNEIERSIEELKKLYGGDGIIDDGYILYFNDVEIGDDELDVTATNILKGFTGELGVTAIDILEGVTGELDEDNKEK